MRPSINSSDDRLAGATWLPLASDGEEFCQDESFTARCHGRHDVIVMETARYGRPRLGRCVHRDLGYLGCTVDALRVLDSRCSGHPHGCSLSIMDRQLRQLRPCPLDVTWHLEAQYTCVQGQSTRSVDFTSTIGCVAQW